MAMRINEFIFKKTLYHTTGDNALTLTLSDKVENYVYCKIFYKRIDVTTEYNSGEKCVEFQVGNKALLETMDASYFTDVGYYGIRIAACYAAISGNTLTRSFGYNITLTTNNTLIFNDTRNEIFITKVVGYK